MFETSKWQFLQSPGTNAGFSLALGVALPFVSMFTLAAFHHLPDKTLYWCGYPLFTAHAILGILLGLSAFYSEFDLEWPVLTRLCAGLGILACILSLPLLGILMRAIPIAQQFKKVQCQDNLKMLGLTAMMYENESDQHRFPPLSARPGELAMEIDSIYPEYLSEFEYLNCRRIRDERLTLQRDSEFLHVLSDQSYYYLGYAIDSPRTMRAFHDAYKQVIAEGGSFQDDLVVPPGQGTWGGDRILRLSRTKRVEISPGTPGTSGTASNDTLSLLPVMIEREENHRKGMSQSGLNVLYNDGSARWCKYPGEWPADEETMRLLSSMDKLGDHIPDGTFQGPMAPSMPLLTFLGLLLGVALFGAWAWISRRNLFMCLFYAVTCALVIGYSVYSSKVDRSTLPIAAPDGTVTIHEMADGK